MIGRVHVRFTLMLGIVVLAVCAAVVMTAGNGEHGLRLLIRITARMSLVVSAFWTDPATGEAHEFTDWDDGHYIAGVERARSELWGSESVRRRATWGLGWRVAAGRESDYLGDLTSARAYGHGGATGTGVWNDPETGVSFVLFSNQPESVRDMLLRTSILDCVNAELAGVLADDPKAADALPALARANAFVLPIGGGWYRYHSLFGELLRLKLRLEHRGQLPDLYRRAARWYQCHDGLNQAS